MDFHKKTFKGEGSTRRNINGDKEEGSQEEKEITTPRRGVGLA